MKGQNYREPREFRIEFIGVQEAMAQGSSSLRHEVAGLSNDVLEVTVANKNQALSLARVIYGR